MEWQTSHPIVVVLSIDRDAAKRTRQSVSMCTKSRLFVAEPNYGRLMFPMIWDHQPPPDVAVLKDHVSA
jgi:hypothetical protein